MKPGAKLLLSLVGLLCLPVRTDASSDAFLSPATTVQLGDDGANVSAFLSGSLWCVVLSQGENGEPTQVKCDGVVFRAGEEEEKEDVLEPGSRAWLTSLAGALVCVCSAALAAGMTLGLTSFDEFALRVLCNRSVDDVEPEKSVEDHARAKEKLLKDQKYAQRILPLISGHIPISSSRTCLNPSSHHALLVTLLLANACANEALPLFLDELVPSWVAILVSVSVVLIFGEVVPSAIFTGPSQLRLAAFFSPVVLCFRCLFFPIVWPLSLALDTCLGHAESANRRGEMKATAKTLLSCGLELDEVNMIHGVLDMHYKTAKDISKPLHEAKMVAHDDVISQELIEKVLSWGHSRVFVYRRDPAEPDRRNDIVGVLLVKKLLGVKLEEHVRVEAATQAMKVPAILDQADNLLSVLNKFQDSMCHLAVVRQSKEVEETADLKLEEGDEGEEEEEKEGQKVGNSSDADADVNQAEEDTAMFCSLEDVIEIVLKEDIYDEEDLELGRVSTQPLQRAGTSHSMLSLARIFSSREFGPGAGVR